MNTLFPILKNGRTPKTSGFRNYPAFSSWVDELINDTFETDVVSNIDKGLTVPAVNIVEKDDAYEVAMAIPGFKKSDFKIDVDKQLLTISSESKTEHKESTDKFTRREFGYTSFKRSFHLPETVNKDSISATYVDGILKVSLPKREEAIDKGVKQIEIS